LQRTLEYFRSQVESGAAAGSVRPAT